MTHLLDDVWKIFLGKLQLIGLAKKKVKVAFFSLLICNEDLNSTFCRFISVRFVLDSKKWDFFKSSCVIY